MELHVIINFHSQGMMICVIFLVLYTRIIQYYKENQCLCFLKKQNAILNDLKTIIQNIIIFIIILYK